MAYVASPYPHGEGHIHDVINVTGLVARTAEERLEKEIEQTIICAASVMVINLQCG